MSWPTLAVCYWRMSAIILPGASASLCSHLGLAGTLHSVCTLSQADRCMSLLILGLLSGELWTVQLHQAAMSESLKAAS